MSVMRWMSVLALRHLADDASRSVGAYGAAHAFNKVAGYLRQHFIDQSERLPQALEKAGDRAWRALEVALAGDSLWDRCKLLLASGEQKGFREQVQRLLEQTDYPSFAAQLTFRPDCLRELQAARKAGLLTGQAYDPDALAEEVGSFARHTDPVALMGAEWQTVERMAGELRAAGYATLATLVALRPRDGAPLLVVAVRYFFRRAVEEDPKLFQGLAFAQMEKLRKEQERFFGSLHKLIVQRGDRLEALLGELREAVEATYATVLDVRAEQRRQGEQNEAIYAAVIRLQERLDLAREQLRPRDSLSVRSDAERQLVRELVARYRGLPDGERRRLPALLNAIGKLEV
ncbi:MAG TPA: hypothetical protein VIL46_09780, partial [Gemmataceae bacterium]